MLAALKRCFLFKNIPEENLPEFLQAIHAETASYEKGDMIFTQVDAPERTMILLEGSVCICNASSMGKRNVVALLDRPGELFGEVFVFLGKATYDNYAQAMTAVKILQIPKQAFTVQQQGSTAFHMTMTANMMTILAQKAYFLNRRLQIISCVTLRQKIAKVLLMHILPDASVNLHMTREELADFLNTTRPSLSRELMHMQTEGLIHIEKKKIYVLDVEELERST